jgi:hypothetical protein
MIHRLTGVNAGIHYEPITAGAQLASEARRRRNHARDKQSPADVTLNVPS